MGLLCPKTFGNNYRVSSFFAAAFMMDVVVNGFLLGLYIYFVTLDKHARNSGLSNLRFPPSSDF